MKVLNNLFENNKNWAEKIKQDNPDFFSNLSKQQAPKYLWIGCSDSRVPANEIVGLLPGEIFVHRNIANVVIHTDLNCMSVIQYAVEVLKVKHIIVCGHYGCGGIQAALEDTEFGLIDNWLLHIKDISGKYNKQLNEQEKESDKLKLMCEINVIEQVKNVSRSTIVQKAWRRNQPLSVHGWIYDIHDGILRDLNMCITGNEELISNA